MSKSKMTKMDAQSAEDERGLHTIQEAQLILHCSRGKIYQLHRAGKLELVKFDRSTRVTERSLIRLLKEVINKPLLLQERK